MSEKKITFFFGAGAEADFEMPTGYQYTLDTILSKRSKMNIALRDFYKERTNEYSSDYSAQALFTKNSHTFKEIVIRAAENLKTKVDVIDRDSKSVVKCYLDFVNEKKTNGNKAKEKEFINKVAKIFEYVYIDIDNLDNKQRQQKIDDSTYSKYARLIKNFSYYGSIEKDFSTIINPIEAGKNRFWRLINYFWNAYFSIIIPVLNLSTEYRNNEEYNKDKYAYVLKNLNKVVDYICSDRYKEQLDKECKSECSYYSVLRKLFPDSKAIATNYTPFLELYGFDESVYLAGKLSQFEIPEELRVVDIREDKEDISSKFIFPYMLTQAPIKPIIDCRQLQEYCKFLRVLQETELLVIIGYNINPNDNHINAILREFLIQKPTNRILFFKYVDEDENFDRDSTIKEVAEKLKIFDDSLKQQIDVCENNGNAIKLAEYLKKV